MANTEYPKVYLYRRIVQAKLFIDEHYAESIDLNQIADQASFSKFHFIRLFKKIYGKAPNKYLISVRINHAVEFFKKEHSVAEVCAAVGYESETTFSALFKRETGVLPSAYLLQQQIQNAAIQQKPLGFIPGCFAEKKGWTEKSNFQEA